MLNNLIHVMRNYRLKLLENFLPGTTVVDELVANLDHDILDYIDIDLARGWSSHHKYFPPNLSLRACVCECFQLSSFCHRFEGIRKENRRERVQWKRSRGNHGNSRGSVWCSLGFAMGRVRELSKTAWRLEKEKRGAEQRERENKEWNINRFASDL